MKKLLLATSAAAMALSSVPAFAEASDLSNLTMTGNVEQICTAVPNSQLQNNNVGNANQTVNGDDVNYVFDFDIANTDDPTSTTIGLSARADFRFAFSTFCNDDFTVTVTPTNGTFDNSSATPVAGFTNTLKYGFTINNSNRAGANVGQGLATNGPKSLAGPAYSGPTRVDISVAPTTAAAPALAGDYQESMTVTFAADGPSA